MHSPLLAIEIDILVLLTVSCLSAITLAKLKPKLKFPYTIALVILGIGLGWLGENIESLAFLQQLSLSHDLILFVFVPPLIFESALSLDSRLLIRNLIPILMLAAPGLLVSTALVGIILSTATPLDLPQALLFGSLISATDPVAVIALFKELGVPKRLGILVEGESLFNDATAIVTFNIILGLIISNQSFDLSALQSGTTAFFVSFVGGIAVGALIGFAAQFLVSLSKESPLIIATLSTIVAYGTFLFAEESLGVSGVIAIVSAGMVLGWYNSNRLRPTDREYIQEFWEYLAFLANSLIFLLVGLTISRLHFFTQLGETEGLLGTIALTIITVLFARAVVVFGLTALFNRIQSSDSISLSYQLTSFWGGLRGAVCLALALSFDPDFPASELILALTIGVVLFTLLIPGTTISALLHSLQLDLPPLFERLNQSLADGFSQRRALEQLSMIEGTFTNPDPAMIAAYTESRETSIEQAKKNLRALCIKAQSIATQNNDDNQNADILQKWIWTIAISLEKQAYQALYDEGFINESFLSQFKLMTTLKLDAILKGDIPPRQPNERALEAQWMQWRLWAGEKWMPQQSWVAQLRKQEQLSTYQFWSILAHITEIIPVRLQSLFSDSGLDSGLETDLNADLLDGCIAQYQQWNQTAQQYIIQTDSSMDSIHLEIQTQISEKIAWFTRNETISELAEIGAISQSTESILLQAMESD